MYFILVNFVKSTKFQLPCWQLAFNYKFSSKQNACVGRAMTSLSYNCNPHANATVLSYCSQNILKAKSRHPPFELGPCHYYLRWKHKQFYYNIDFIYLCIVIYFLPWTSKLLLRSPLEMNKPQRSYRGHVFTKLPLLCK